MRVFNYIKCVIVGHDVSGSESIVETFCSNNWLKRCNRCGRYIMHGDIGSVCMSEKEALKVKRDFERYMRDVRLRF